MNWNTYLQQFTAILDGKNNASPYDQESYLNYVKLNFSRQKRWLKTGRLDEELKNIIKNIDTIQHWTFITEPWCGDAAHCLPFLYLLSQENENIHIEIQLRDAPPFLIENHLTNGGKAIPKVIIQDEKGNELFVWGPRPEAAKNFLEGLKKKTDNKDEIKEALQNWYNQDKGKSIQDDLKLLFLKPL